eukprot:m.961972 g.961972  ORF g.961972 m.961972 type:complete len:197 (+) comp23888_c1_seq4:206-796(+)
MGCLCLSVYVCLCLCSLAMRIVFVSWSMTCMSVSVSVSVSGVSETLPVRAQRGLLHSCHMDWTLFWQQLVLLTPEHCDVITEDLVRDVLRPASYDDAAFHARLPQWMQWVTRWRAVVSKTDATATMARVSPRYVPREWLLVRAYTGAEHGDMSVLQEAQELFARPYTRSASDEMDRMYFQKAPPPLQDKAGIAYFS